MQYHEFIGQVQNRLELGTQAEAVRATRAVLESLGERLQAGEATDLAGPLPMEVDYYLESADHGQRFDYREFVRRVAERQGMDPDDDGDRADAAYHAQVVMGLVSEQVPPNELRQVHEQLPGDDGWNELFELAAYDWLSEG